MATQIPYTRKRAVRASVVADGVLRCAHREHEPIGERLALLESGHPDAPPLDDLHLLAGGVAHDLNNLLSVVLGTAELMSLDFPQESPEGISIAQIALAARRAADLTRQLMTYARKEHIAVERLDLNTLVEELISLLNGALSPYVTLRSRLRSLPPISANATQIRQVILNLIINAIEAVGERPGVVTVATHVVQTNLTRDMAGVVNLPVGDYVVFEVRDTGCGMDAATLARIFEPAFTTKPRGQGLGLAAVRQIVHGCGGMLNVTSTPGYGTSFIVLFPCAKAHSWEDMAESYHDTAWKLATDEELPMASTALLEHAIGG